jgi:ssDNA-binding replication factor A large subunit
LSGKVVSIEPSRDFVRQDGSAGRVLSVVLEDETAKVRCAIWDDKADQVTKYGEITGKSITIRYGYTRTGLAGEVELNVGERSEITLTAEAGTSSPTLVEQEHPREEVEQDSNPKRLAELDSYLESKISELESEAKRLKSMRSAIRRIYE